MACALPLGAPSALAGTSPVKGEEGFASSPLAGEVPAGGGGSRKLRLIALENLVETGYVAPLPDTGYTGTLLLGRQDLAGGTVVDLDLAGAGGREKRVSRRHARLDYTGGLVTVLDWESAHGTWVNKRRLAPGEGAVLADGDELRLADFVFRVELR